MQIITSPIKWAGGKRQLIDKIKERLPKTFNTYFEPFLGSGAVFFDLLPDKAVINDLNFGLINMYQQIKENPEKICYNLEKLQREYNELFTEKEQTIYYNRRRIEFNEYLQSLKNDSYFAALFIFLNKTGFNGLYRVNSKNEFNVPSSHKVKVHLYDKENIEKISDILKSVTILNTDFENAVKDAKSDDFIFFDSPYYDNFSNYCMDGFKTEEHIRLKSLVDKLTQENVQIMLTNSNKDFIKDLYRNYRIEVIDVKRMINRNGNNRIGQEVIIRNY